MFTVQAKGPNRVDIQLDGRLDAEGMKVALDDLISKTTDIEHGRMLYEIGDFDIPTLGAIAVELSRLPQLFGLIRRFDRAAVLADQAWIQTISEIEGALFPGLEIKAFGRDQREEAETWLAQ